MALHNEEPHSNATKLHQDHPRFNSVGINSHNGKGSARLHSVTCGKFNPTSVANHISILQGKNTEHADILVRKLLESMELNTFSTNCLRTNVNTFDAPAGISQGFNLHASHILDQLSNSDCASLRSSKQCTRPQTNNVESRRHKSNENLHITDQGLKMDHKKRS